MRRDALFWHYPHYSNQGGKPGGAIRQGNIKLIEWYEDRRVEMYDLARDVGEKKDLVGRTPGRSRPTSAIGWPDGGSRSRPRCPRPTRNTGPKSFRPDERTT